MRVPMWSLHWTGRQTLTLAGNPIRGPPPSTHADPCWQSVSTWQPPSRSEQLPKQVPPQPSPPVLPQGTFEQSGLHWHLPHGAFGDPHWLAPALVSQIAGQQMLLMKRAASKRVPLLRPHTPVEQSESSAQGSPTKHLPHNDEGAPQNCSRASDAQTLAQQTRSVGPFPK